ncbi:MAG: pilus assembly protein PilP [Proteobacteria bacterium]|nr:MAG: pilus assembly protein PilP [Pseudomonadota bacterium]QKK10903.1 MAG: pilus assembly protein PilP [Pseudomonadota bacterium]
MTVRTGLRIGHICLVSIVALGLAACESAELNDLREYVAQVKARNPGRIDPLPEVQIYQSHSYSVADLRDPFSKPQTRQQEAERQSASVGGISPDFNRPRELLEEYPLDSLRMVGTLEREQKVWAIVKANDGTIHRVVGGNYMGQNHGKIVRISDNQVELTEIIPDGAGGWQERNAALALGGDQ